MLDITALVQLLDLIQQMGQLVTFVQKEDIVVCVNSNNTVILKFYAAVPTAPQISSFYTGHPF